MHAAKYLPWCRVGAWTRWLSVGMSEAAAKHGFSLRSTEHPFSDPEPVNFFMRPRELGLRTNPLRVDRKIYHLRISVSARAALVPLLVWLPACVARDFCNPKKTDALGDDSSFYVVIQQQWRACVRRMLRCKLACIWPPSSVDPRLASGAFVVAKDEGRDRFIGTRRPLNSRERSIGRAHLPVAYGSDA